MSIEQHFSKMDRKYTSSTILCHLRTPLYNYLLQSPRKMKADDTKLLASWFNSQCVWKGDNLYSLKTIHLFYIIIREKIILLFVYKITLQKCVTKPLKKSSFSLELNNSKVKFLQFRILTFKHTKTIKPIIEALLRCYL